MLRFRIFFVEYFHYTNISTLVKEQPNNIYMQTDWRLNMFTVFFLVIFAWFVQCYFGLNQLGKYIRSLKCDAKYEGSNNYVYKYFYEYNFISFTSEKVKVRKEKVGERRFVLYQQICTMYLSSKIHRKLITFFAYQNMIMVIIRSCNQWVF